MTGIATVEGFVASGKAVFEYISHGDELDWAEFAG
jgi:hypothetical protein